MWINYTNFCWKSWLISEFIISKWWINDSTRRLILNHYHKLILWLTTNHQAQRVERQIITNANLNFSSLSQHSFQKLNHLYGISKFKVSDLILFLSHQGSHVLFYFLIDFFKSYFLLWHSDIGPWLWHEKSAEYFCSARSRSVKLSMCWACAELGVNS